VRSPSRWFKQACSDSPGKTGTVVCAPCGTCCETGCSTTGSTSRTSPSPLADAAGRYREIISATRRRTGSASSSISRACCPVIEIDKKFCVTELLLNESCISGFANRVGYNRSNTHPVPCHSSAPASIFCNRLYNRSATARLIFSTKTLSRRYSRKVSSVIRPLTLPLRHLILSPRHRKLSAPR
jgi:hypothetical protein